MQICVGSRKPPRACHVRNGPQSVEELLKLNELNARGRSKNMVIAALLRLVGPDVTHENFIYWDRDSSSFPKRPCRSRALHQGGAGGVRTPTVTIACAGIIHDGTLLTPDKETGKVAKKLSLDKHEPGRAEGDPRRRASGPADRTRRDC